MRLYKKWITVVGLSSALASGIVSNAETAQSAELYKLQRPQIVYTKHKIQQVLGDLDATLTERALVTAIASLETDAFAVDYSFGDDKSGDAYNVSIYKLNIGMLKDLGISDFKRVHTDLSYATETVLQGLRQMGTTKFLMYHRGGAGAFDGAVPIDDIAPYIDAIHKIANMYEHSIPDMYNNIRYTIQVDPI